MPIPRKLLPLTNSGFSHLIIPTLIVVVIAVLGGMVYEEISKAATPANADYLQSGIADKCLDDAYDAKANYTKVQLYSCNKSAAQQWVINSNGTIENANGACLDLDQAKDANNTKLVVYSCNTNAAQQWKLTNNTLVNPESGKCIDDPYSSTANGTQLVLYTCKGTSNQQWTAVSAGSASPNDTVVLNGSSSSITDSAGNTWTVSGGVIKKNGTSDTATSNVLEIAYVNGVVWQENNLDYWWSWTGTAWSPDSDTGLTTSPLSGGSGAAGGGGGGVTTFGTCTQTLNGSQDGVSLENNKYHIQANEWASSAPFDICTDGGPHFRITTSGLNSSNITVQYAPGAYPSLYVGCHSNSCTTGSGLPLQVSAMTGGGKVTSDYSTVTTQTSGGDKWDDSYDIWFNNNNSPASANNGLGDLEMMVWLNDSGGAQPAGSVVRSNVNIGGITYNVWYNGSGTVSYVIANPVEQVTNLDIGLLAADAVAHDYGQNGGINSSWYLLDVEAGFETWDSVTGLTANNFSVDVQ